MWMQAEETLRSNPVRPTVNILRGHYQMETFHEPTSFVMQSKHKIAPPTMTVDDDVKSSFNLNTTDLFRVAIEGKQWNMVFRRWHGAHALFYNPTRDNTAAIHYTDLRKLVKRIKA